MGRNIRASAVYHQARKIFENWNQALSAAGIDPTLVSPQVKWSAQLVLNCLKYLNESDVASEKTGV